MLTCSAAAAVVVERLIYMQGVAYIDPSHPVQYVHKGICVYAKHAHSFFPSIQRSPSPL
jgi:hypothetical protein